MPRPRSTLWISVGATLVASCSSDSRPAGPPPPATACQALTEDGGGVTVGSGAADDPARPRPAAFYQPGRTAVTAKTYLVVTEHPLASRAGCEILAAGGTAMDAAVAVQMVLGLVEPQSSGIGGGAFLLYYDATAKAVTSYDGRETAPAAASEDYLRFIDADHPVPPRPSARASGRAIGTPGVLRMLELAHHDHGRAAWRDLFAPAIRLATDGFPISGRLALAIEQTPDLLADAEATQTYFNADHSPKRLGSTLKVPAYAGALTALAAGGADAFYTGELAQSIVDQIATTQGATGGEITPGLTTAADLAGYQAKRRDAICTTYRAYSVCGMPPPSSGGIAVAQTLGMLERFDLAADRPTAIDGEGGVPSVTAAHRISEAERLAYADRDAYVADADFVPLPGPAPDAMWSKPYLAARAMQIGEVSIGVAPAGDFGAAAPGIDRTPEHGTSQVTIVDADGNALAMTTTVESTFGAFHMTHGVILNNQLTDFSAVPGDGNAPIANRVAGGKRPRSSMAPTLVFRTASDGTLGELVMATGSPGGATIIQYVVKTLVGVLDWGLDAQQAAAMVDFGAANDPVTNIGGEHPGIRADDDPLVAGLRARGHTVDTAPQTSGVATVIRVPTAGGSVLVGGADPRREGIALGDAFAP